MATQAENSLFRFFISHLDRIYCGKTHIIDSLPKLSKMTEFTDLKMAIIETCEDIVKQIKRMDKIYRLLNTQPQQAPCIGMTILLHEMFDGINTNFGDKPLCDLSLIFYLQNIESIEASSFQILKLTAESLNNPEINQLLQENFDESSDDRNLLLQVSQKFLQLKSLKSVKI